MRIKKSGESKKYYGNLDRLLFEIPILYGNCRQSGWCIAKYFKLAAGDPAPNFKQRTNSDPFFAFDTAGGRYLVRCFFGIAAESHSQAALEAAMTRRKFFDDTTASSFDVRNDPADEAEKRVTDQLPGYRYFGDNLGGSWRVQVWLTDVWRRRN